MTHRHSIATQRAALLSRGGLARTALAASIASGGRRGGTGIIEGDGCGRQCQITRSAASRTIPRTSASSRTRSGAVVDRPLWPIVHIRSLWACTGGASRSIGLAHADLSAVLPLPGVPDKCGVVAQKNAVVMPRTMSAQATSIRIQSRSWRVMASPASDLPSVAAHAGHVNYRTIEGWRSQGRSDSGPR
jgi:hypothetical protein